MLPQVLALDIATTTGWALRRSNGRIESGRLVLTTGNHPGQRHAQLRAFLTEVKNRAGGLEWVVWEDAFRQPGKAAALFGQLVGVVLAWSQHHQIGVMSVGVSAIKKFATGNGAADKAAMIAATDVPVIDDNEADARHLLRFVLASNPHLQNGVVAA